MRLPIIEPSELSKEQQSLYEDMRAGIAANFKGFVNIRADGALLGPWNPWIREPKFGKPVWELVKAMVSSPSLPAEVREVAILVTGSHFRSGYELYAHVLVAEGRGLSDEKLATIVAGQRPAGSGTSAGGLGAGVAGTSLDLPGNHPQSSSVDAPAAGCDGRRKSPRR